MTEDNKDQLRGKDLLVAYYDVDYEKNPKGSNYWRNRCVCVSLFCLAEPVCPLIPGTVAPFTLQTQHSI